VIKPWNGNSLVIILFSWVYSEMIDLLKMSLKAIFLQKELSINKNIRLELKDYFILKNLKIYLCFKSKVQDLKFIMLIMPIYYMKLMLIKEQF